MIRTAAHDDPTPCRRCGCGIFDQEDIVDGVCRWCDEEEIAAAMREESEEYARIYGVEMD